MKYSVIIPHYSKEGTILLERAIASIPQREDIEILVVDNSPIQISSSFAENDNRVSIYYSDNKKGAGHARNVGIEKAIGSWVLFLDADDFFEENAFNLFDQYTTKDNDVVFFKFNSVYSDTLEKADRDFFFNFFIDEYIKDKNNEDNLRYRFITPCSKLIRMKVMKENNVKFEEVQVGNDVMFSVQLGFCAETIAADSTPVYCATVNKGSLVNIVSKQNYTERFLGKIRMNKYLKDNKIRVRASVMSDILGSMKYGIGTFCFFLLTAISTGNINLFNRRYLSNIKKYFASKRDKKYLVKENL